MAASPRCGVCGGVSGGGAPASVEGRVIVSFRWGEHGEIDASGHRLEAVSWGPPPDAAPTIVLLHEGLGCVALWRDFPKALASATGCGVFAYSRPGYGGSSAAASAFPTDYMTRHALDVLPGVLDEIGFWRGCLFGHSDGATIAAEYAGRIADMRLRGLILMAPHFFAEPMSLREIARAKEAFETGGLRAGMAKYHRDPDAAFRNWNNAWLSPEFAAWNVEASLDSIGVPVLGVQGRRDEYGTLAQMRAIETRCSAPTEIAIIEACGHSPHLERCEETLAVVAKFIERCDWRNCAR